MSTTPPSARVSWFREARAIAHLAVPLALTQLAYIAIMTTDVVMMGWLGPDALAAGALAGHFHLLFSLFAMGILTGATPVLAQHLGARRFRRIRPTMHHGFWLAILLAVPCAAVIWQAGTILVFLGQDPRIAADGQSYLRYMVWGLLSARRRRPDRVQGRPPGPQGHPHPHADRVRHELGPGPPDRGAARHRPRLRR